MSGTTFVFVHGGLHGAWCWDRLVPLLPSPALAIDLPGRPGNPGPKPLSELGIGDFVDSVVHDVVHAGLERLVLVGHSMAGLSVPSIAERLAGRVEAMILVGAVVPGPGKAMVDDAAPAMRPYLRRRFSRQMHRPGGSMTLPRWMARAMFCNDMNPRDTSWVLDRLVPDAPAIALEPVPAVQLPPDMGVGYVKMLRDRAVLPKQADRCIGRLEDAVVREIDAGHDAMISEPAALVGAIVEIAAEIGRR
jgi:pimeloyl-ACP methyl ester carboxylesterase